MDLQFLTNIPDQVVIISLSRTYPQVDSLIQANQQINLKDTENQDKYQDLAKELKYF